MGAEQFADVVVDEHGHGQRIIDETRYGAAVGDAMVEHHNGRGRFLVDHQLLKQARTELPHQAI